MKKTFEQFKVEVENAIKELNDSKPKTRDGLRIIERMATFKEGSYGDCYIATIYYRWTDLEGNPLEDFHRDKRYWRIIWDRFSDESGKWHSANKAEYYSAKRLSTILKKM